jgi:PST family polysaccharide transporter
MKKYISLVVDLLKNYEYKRIFENFLSLSVLNVLNYIFPLIFLPYLVRVLGAEKYGTIAFSLIIMQYVILFTNYGFVISATKLISIFRNNPHRLSIVFSSVIIIRLLFCFIAGLILIIVSLFWHKLSSEKELYFFGYLYIIGEALTSTWFFQGLEKMKFVTLTNVLSKGFFTIIVFFVIHNESDYTTVVLLQALGYLLSSIFSIGIIKKYFKIQFRAPKLLFIRWILRDGWSVFVSTLAMNLYRNLNGFLLGVLTNDTFVGLYIAAEKVVKAIQGIVSPLSESLFPYFSKKFNQKATIDNLKILFRLGKYYFVVLFLIAALIFILSPFIVKILFGIDFIDTILNFKIMSMIIVFGALNYLFGIVGMINMNFKTEFGRIVLITGVLSVILNFILVPVLKDKGASICLLFSELILFLMIFGFLMMKRRKQLSGLPVNSP